MKKQYCAPLMILLPFSCKMTVLGSSEVSLLDCDNLAKDSFGVTWNE